MVPMTGVGIHGCRSDDWLAYRLEIFKKYTLESLRKQTNRNFLLLLTFRPEEEGNPLVYKLGDYMNEIQMPTMISFNGLMYHDDKFSWRPRSLVMNIGRIVRQAWREKDLRQLLLIPRVFKRMNSSLPQRLETTLYELSRFPQFLDANYIYFTRIDSDDMFHKETVAEIQKVPPFEGAITVTDGYVYNQKTGELADWRPKTNPPFQTLVFLASKFFNPVEHVRAYKDFKSHEDIPKVFKCHDLGKGKYCVLVHGQQISTIFDHPFRGEIIEDLSILKNFGIEDT